MHTLILCPACGGEHSEVAAFLGPESIARFAEFDRRKYDGLLSKWVDSISLVVSRCNACGHCWYRNQPEPEQLSHMYAIGRSLTHNTRPTREPTPSMRNEMRRIGKLIGSLHRSSTLLDFGSGLGRWARAAVLEGFQVTAYEPSIERGAELDAPFQLVHSLEAISGQTFAAIQLEQVLEHVPDPLKTLIDLHKFCNSRTVIRVAVPNILRAPEGKHIWTTWPYDGKSPHILAPFEHLHGFTPNSLDHLLKRAGLKNITLIAEAKCTRVNLIRRMIGRVLPTMNSTLRYVQLA